MTSFTLERLQLATPRLTMAYARVPWDSAAFGFGVGQILALQVIDPAADCAEAFASFERWRDAEAIELVSCRLHHLQLHESMLLESRGFRFIELVYHPRFDTVASFDGVDEGIHVSAASEADLPVLEGIARSAFSTGRYELDHRLPATAGRERYASWVRSSLADSTQRVLKAEENGAIVGFFIVETRPDRGCRWHLTAIANEHQGRGVGKRVWRAMLGLHRAEGITVVDTVVSAHNLAVLNLYAGLGFRLREAEMTFHWLRDRDR